MLRPHVRVKTGVRGWSCKFVRYGRGVATPRIPHTDVVPMGQSYARPGAILSDWNAAEYTDMFD